MAKKNETRVPKSWDELFPGRFLKAADLKGKAVTVTITRVYQEKIDGEWALIFAFKEGTDKTEMACNRTNGEHMGAMFGKDPTKWIGHRITLKGEGVWAFGEQMEAIRIVGSPELPNDVKVDIEQGRLRIHRVLKRTGNGGPPTSRSKA